MLMKWFLSGWLLLIAGLLQADDNFSFLERQFLEDDALQRQNVFADLPPAVQQMVFFSTGTRIIANRGEKWSSADVIELGEPTVQHQFSLVSEHTAAVLYHRGGFAGVSAFLLLMDRADPGVACEYALEGFIDTPDELLHLLDPDDEKEVPISRRSFCKPFDLGTQRP